MRVMVTGGAGYVGSVIVDELIGRGYDVVVYDDLSRGHADAVPDIATLIQADLLDIEEVLAAGRLPVPIDAVMHLAASSIVAESMRLPERYYENNVVASLRLLAALPALGAHAVVFSSSAAVYGEPDRPRIDETAATTPSNPYGESQLVIERALHWHHVAHELPYVTLRGFNAAGATADCGERHHPETHLIPTVLAAAISGASVRIFGHDHRTRDGTCERDYVHVADLADAHVRALQALVGGEISEAVFNVSGGTGHTVREVIDVARRITGRSIDVETWPRRPGDPAALVGNADLIRETLGWTATRSTLDEIVSSAWDFLLQESEVSKQYDTAEGRR